MIHGEFNEKYIYKEYGKESYNLVGKKNHANYTQKTFGLK